MSKAKKVIAGALTVTTGLWLMGASFFVPVASAQTTADLQAQIQALLAQIAALQAQLNASAGGGATFQFTRNLTIGSTGEDVRQLQIYLNSKGFTVASAGAGSPGRETTYFGSLTRAALARYQAANGISPAVGYFGPITRSHVASSGGVIVVPPGGVPPVSGAFVLQLAVDSPAGSVVPKGATGVTVLKFRASGGGTLDSVTFKRTGIGATADFNSSGLYLYEGSTRLTTGKTINSTTHEVSFPNLALQVSGTRTFSLVADISASAVAGNRSAFQLVASAGSPTPAGALAGNTFEIGGQPVGSITVDNGAAPVNPKLGQVGAKLLEFKLTAGSVEDIEVRRISFTEGGSIANSNLSNFVVKQAGNTIATAASVGAKDLITFELSSPFVLEKGQNRTFEIFGDIGGSARADDTIVLYVENSADVYATGKTYGFGVTPTITGIDTTADSDTLTVQGGQVTITFNGPISGDIARQAQDVTVFDFSIASQNNIEIKNLRMHATTTGLTSTKGFNDMKVWDANSNAVLTSATDVTTSSDVTFTDVVNVSAGQSRRFKVTVDVDVDNADGDDIQVSLLAFSLGDIKNLDNNTNVALANIVPNSTISGNVLDTRVPTLDLQLSATPSSQTYVQGTNGVDLVGFSFRATGGNVRLSQVKVTATSTTGTLTNAELTSLGLYDGATRISDVESLDSTALTATFDGLNLTINNGQTKVLTVKGNVDVNATNADVYAVRIAALTDVTAYDLDGNSATVSGTTANSGNTVAVTVANVGNVTVVAAPSDSETEAGIVLAGQESVLAKFRVTSADENMTVNKMSILVNNSNSATATSSAAADEFPSVKLYDGSTLLGTFSINASGASSGVAIVENLNWIVPKDQTKVLTVKGAANSISQGADTGASVWAHVQAVGFEAQGSTNKDTTITAASGNEKQVFKTKPVVSKSATQDGNKLGVGEKIVLRFKVKADGPEQIAWKKLAFQVSMTGATMSAVTAAPGTTGNIRLREVGGSYLSIATAFSGTGVASTSQNAVTGGNTGYVGIIMTSEQAISAGSEKEYELSLTFADVSGTVGAASADVKVYRQETASVASNTFSSIEGTQDTATPSLVWSDYSATGHAETTSDWSNGRFVKELPTSGNVISN